MGAGHPRMYGEMVYQYWHEHGNERFQNARRPAQLTDANFWEKWQEAHSVAALPWSFARLEEVADFLGVSKDRPMHFW